MDVSSVGVNSGVQYTPKSNDVVREKAERAPKEEIKDLGVIVEISGDSPKAQKINEAIQQRIQNGGRSISATHRVVGNAADGKVSFYGASVTQEQSEKLQDVINGLETQGNDALGNSWDVGAYAQLGLKVSQLSYACKEMGLSDEAASQISSTYGKQAEDKINKFQEMAEFGYKQGKIALEELYKKQGTPNYRKDADVIRESLVQKSSTGKTSDMLNAEANNDIYRMFSNLDTSSKDAFVSSFEKAVAGFKNYRAGGEVAIFTGTSAQQAQIAELTKRFQSFLGM